MAIGHCCLEREVPQAWKARRTELVLSAKLVQQQAVLAM
jgi:hypothetical protein